MNSINVDPYLIFLNSEPDRISSIDSSLWVERHLLNDDVDNSTVVSFEKHEDNVDWARIEECYTLPQKEDQNVVVDNSTVVSFEKHEDNVDWARTGCYAHPQKDQNVVRQVSDISDVVSIQQSPTEPINELSSYDVVNGCGRGILKLPGNATYRELVSLNKRIYARCHHLDKAKVSQGIVAAIRVFGGRFLEYDKESKTYHEIGDTMAQKKTSQALREGQKKIRQQILSDLSTGRNVSGLEGSLHVPLPIEKYVDYSVQMLEGIYAK